MPTYDFRCPAGHDFERFFGRISEAPAEVECPECGAVATRRISGGAGLLFKGSGFYITDYGKDGKKDQRSTAGGAAKGGDAAGGGKSESGGSSTSGSAGGDGGKGSGSGGSGTGGASGGTSGGGSSSGGTSGGTSSGGASKAGGE